MRIAIFGTGGVGGYFGGRLAQAGEEVVFIARGQHLQAIRREGLRVDSVKGDFTIQPAWATDDPAQVGPVDAVLVGVKAWQVNPAAQAIQPLVGRETFVVPLQNGVEAASQLADTLGKEHVLGGLCKISSYIAAPGHIRHVGIEPYIAFGELDNRPSQRSQRLKQAFERVNEWVEIPADIQAAIWEKFLFIAAISGVCAVTRSPVGVVRSLPGTRRMIEVAMQEINALAQARGVTLPEAVVADTMAYTDSLPAETSPSMQRDILAGRPSELDAQNGAVVRMGEQSGVPTPINAFLYYSLLPLELHARGAGVLSASPIPLSQPIVTPAFMPALVIQFLQYGEQTSAHR